MSKLLKLTERFLIMNRLIKEQKIGKTTVFAKRLGISRSHLFNLLDEIRSLGVTVEYNNSLRSYEYLGDTELKVQKPLVVIKKKENLKNISGGDGFSNSSSSNHIVNLHGKCLFHHSLTSHS